MGQRRAVTKYHIINYEIVGIIKEFTYLGSIINGKGSSVAIKIT